MPMKMINQEFLVSSLYTVITQYSITAMCLMMSAFLLHPNISAPQAFAQPLIGTNPQVKSNIVTPSKDIINNTSSSNALISLHTTYTIQAHNINLLNEELPVLKRAAASAVTYAVLVAKGSPTGNNTVNVSTKIINQLSNNRVDTTQGIDFTKKLIGTELSNAIGTMMAPPSSAIANVVQNTPSQEQQPQLVQLVVDDQATCNNIASATAACSMDITIRN